jgi:molecular chaperone GrpE
MEQDDIQEIREKAERFESQYNKLKQEFKDYIEASRKNELNKKQEMKTDFAKKLLVIADSLDRISGLDNNASCDIVRNYYENMNKNIDAVYHQLLVASGLISINPKRGDEFNEKMHVAVGLEYSGAYPENSVIRVIRKGYCIENKLVRPSEVIVSKRLAQVKVTRPSLWTRLLRWINPSKYTFLEINKKIYELEGSQKEQIETLSQDIHSLKNSLIRLDEKIITLMESASSQTDDAFDDTDQYQENEAFETNENKQYW